MSRTARFNEWDRTPERVAATKFQRMKREACVSDQLFDLKLPDNARTDMVPAGKYGIVHAIYLAAIGVATIGWLWLIAWCALQLI